MPDASEPFHVLRLVLCTQQRSIPIAFGGSARMRPGATRGQFRWKRALNPKGLLNPGKFEEGNDLLNRTVAVFAERDCGVMDGVRICWTTISV